MSVNVWDEEQESVRNGDRTPIISILPSQCVSGSHTSCCVIFSRSADVRIRTLTQNHSCLFLKFPVDVCFFRRAPLEIYSPVSNKTFLLSTQPQSDECK